MDKLKGSFLLLLLHVSFYVGSYLLYTQGFISQSTFAGALVAYQFLGVAIFFIEFYQWLRNQTVYIFWLLVGVIQFLIGMSKNAFDVPIEIQGDYKGLYALPILLILFQGFRQISLKVYGYDLILFVKGYSSVEEIDRRKARGSDIFLTLLFSGLYFAFYFLFCYNYN